MNIENTIKNTIDYFHMEAPSATVSMKLGPDLQTTLMADGLCRISGTHPGIGLEDAKASTACVFGCRGQNRIFIVSLGRQANIHVYWRLVIAILSNSSFGWMITATDTVYLKLYLSCQLNVF